MICLLLLLTNIAVGNFMENNLVTIKYGTLRGFEDTSVDGRSFWTFLGIPFAKPPIGELRFKDPEIPNSWHGVRDASDMPDYCLQKSFILEAIGREDIYVGKEDCLYLNVYTPKINPKRHLPVMVFIHGGGFYCGGAQEYTGHSLMDRDVVLVVLQYRVGVFGFFSMDDSDFLGNYGMKDQTMALKWVQENIANFGGNPDSVTIFGESAGGVCVQYHMLSTLSKGIFHRAIQQSGSVLSPYAFSTGSSHHALNLSKALGCSLDSDVNDFRICMLNADGFNLLKESYNYESLQPLPNIYVPKVDGDFLLEEPAALIKKAKYTKVNLILGVTQDEGANLILRDDLWRNMHKNLKTALYFDGEENGDQLTRALESRYFGNAGFKENPSLEGKQMLEDYIEIYGHQVTADFHSRDKTVNTYFYEFKFKAEFNIFDPKLRISDNVVDHTTDLVFLFIGGGLFNRTMKDEQNIKMRHIMLDLWTNFALTGNPTPDESLDIIWKPVNNGGLKYLEIKPILEMKTDFRRETMNFWKELPLRMNNILFPKRTEL